ncbi:MAG: ATP-binding protein [Patescibacteria group bacterium]
MKLYPKLFLTLGCALIGALGLLGSILSYSYTHTLRTTIADTELTSTAQTMTAINRFLLERSLGAQTIASKQALIAALKEQTITQPETQTQLEESCIRFISLTGPWDELRIFSAQEQSILSVNPIGQHQLPDDPIDLTFVQAALEKETLVVSDVVQARNGKPTMVFAAPIKSSTAYNATTLGVVVLHLTWPAVTEILTTLDEKRLFLFNAQGNLISTNAPTVSSYSLQDTSLLLTTTEPRNLTLTPQQSEGEQIFASVVPQQPFLTYQGHGWKLVSEIPTREAFAPIQNLITLASFTSIVVLCLTGFLLAVLLRRFLVQPIERLSVMAQAMKDGRYDKRTVISNQDELGKLGEALNAMAETIEASYQQLERRVQEKTQALNTQVENLETTKKATLNILEDLSTAKQVVQQEQAKDEALLNSIGDGLIAIDDQGLITYINEAAVHLLGETQKQFVGTPFHKAWTVRTEEGTEVPLAQRPVQQALLGNTKVLSSDYIYVRKDGTSFAAATTATPIISHGQTLGVILVIRDISHEKSIDRAKSEFVSLASHQLRTPLSAINWYTEMLLAGDAGPLQPEQTKFLQEINEGNQRMIVLVNSLLNVSRLELGTFTIEPQPTNVIDIAQAVLKELTGQIQIKHLTINTSFSTTLPLLSVDPKLMRMIFENLLSNAVKYTPAEGTVSISVQPQDRDLLITVQDNGFGIPEAQQSKIFTKLFRADNVRAKDTEGTGLGLYIVHSILENSGGKIWFTSVENKGTTFFVTIPLTGMQKKTGTRELS